MSSESDVEAELARLKGSSAPGELSGSDTAGALSAGADPATQAGSEQPVEQTAEDGKP
jgi:hypothetical protein